ncbi:hypothetical protein [Lysinibacter cavernae]|uniref:Uncharacterized protein n=1 Tax=Lysinibacter cavernae TaxID=1640652 RepID=A0A7X5TUV3_9MICO|nr:hypothetical protein [Lysinibacter cavernae]NIH54999.1 hypothetical protein [Lysinibacter cavernae]
MSNINGNSTPDEPTQNEPNRDRHGPAETIHSRSGPSAAGARDADAKRATYPPAHAVPSTSAPHGEVRHDPIQDDDPRRKEPAPIDDPAREWKQPAVTTSSGHGWLIAGVFAVIISIVVLGWLSQLQPGPAVLGIALVIALFIGMVVVRMTVTGLRVRLVVLAILLGLMWLIAIAAALIIGSGEWQNLDETAAFSLQIFRS